MNDRRPPVIQVREPLVPFERPSIRLCSGYSVQLHKKDSRAEVYVEE